MGWLKDTLYKIIPKRWLYADTLNGYSPMYSQFGQNIYASDVVQQSVNCIVSELKKLQINHIKTNGQDLTPVEGSLQRVLTNPNELMTQSDFIEKIAWQLLFNYNSFIVPTYYVNTFTDGTKKRVYTGLYPIQPSQVDFIEDESKRLFVKFTFANGFDTTIAYGDVIHIRYRYSVNEYMGGNESGQPDNDALLKTLDINDTLLKGVAKAMKASYAVNGVIKYNTFIDDGQVEANLKELEKKLQNSESGFMPLDLKGEFIPITKNAQLVNADTLKFIDEKILRHWGVSLTILTGDYKTAQYNAFYQKTLEPIIISMSQAFTKGLFSQRERDFGNCIKFYPKELIFMSVDQTLEMIRLLGDSGAMFENEKRVALGLKPLAELEGVRKMSLNYVDVNIANTYQTNGGGTNGSE